MLKEGREGKIVGQKTWKTVRLGRGDSGLSAYWF